MRSITARLRGLFKAPTVLELEERKDMNGLWKRTFLLQEGAAAIRALGRMGNEAFPFLIAILRKPNQSFSGALTSHRNAQRVLEISGAGASEVWDAVRNADDKDVRDWAEGRRQGLIDQELLRRVEGAAELTKALASEVLHTRSDSVIRAFAERARTLEARSAVAPLKKMLGRSHPELKGSTEKELLRALVALGQTGEYSRRLDHALGRPPSPSVSVSLHHNMWQYINEGPIHPSLSKELNSVLALRNRRLKVSDRALITESEGRFSLEDGARTYRISRGREVSIKESDETFYKVDLEVH